MKNVFICSKCDAQFPKWSGRCSECGAWSSLKEQVVGSEKEKKELEFTPADIIDLGKIEETKEERIRTGVREVDRVFGGGIVPGSLILIGGEPGIGKSTIVAQIANTIAKKNKTVIYASGEESAIQVKGRMKRLNCDLENIKFISDTNSEKVASSLKKEKPSLAVIDSIQTFCSAASPAEAGSVSQIRASAGIFLEVAKKYDIPVIIIGHITKDGLIAGPKSLEHIVDTVVYLEAEKNSNYRILRANKNRFGSVNEIGIFEMETSGFKEVKNPSSIFIEGQGEKIAGSVLSCIIEGSRPFLIEIQALVTKTIFGYPQRKSSGFDLNRLQVLTAVLTKRAGINLSNQDVILNIVGGVKVKDPAIDLAVSYAMASSLLNRTVDRETIVLGEVGLGGELRSVARLGERLKEAKKLGFKSAIVPNINIKDYGMKLIKLKNLEELIKNT